MVVVNIASVFFDIRLILVTEGLSVLNSVLQVCGGESEGLSSNKHIGGLGNLKLVVLSSKESVSVLEARNLLGEVWSKERGRRGISSVIVVVIVINFSRSLCS